MKVTVTFNTVKIVVPCGDGEITVRELTQLATTRYKKATGKPRLSWVSVHSLKAKEGGILDPDDRLVDVCDDREQLIAFYDEEGIPQGGDGMSASSDESETTGGSSGYNRNTDIEVSGEFGVCALQVRRGSEPALNKLESGVQGGQSGGGPGQHYHGGEENKRWSAAVMNRDIRSSKNDLSVIDEASFYGDANFDPGGGRYSPLPPPFERGQGSGAARDSDRPTPFSRDSNRLSMQIGHEDGRWLEAAEKASSDQNQGFQPPPPSSTAIEADFGADRLGSGRTCHPVRREPLGGSSPPQHSLDRDSFTRFVIHNEIGPLGIHVVPSGDPEAAGLLIQGIEPGGRIDRDGRLAVNDRIVEINGYPLTEIPFHKAQEIFKEALFAKELLLVVDKSEESARQEQMEDNKENINLELDNSGTLGRKLGAGPGSKLTSTVQAANTRKIGKKLYVSLVKGVHGLGFSITTRDIQAGGVAPIYIKNILPKGAAIENGQLRPGDRLLEVNQESMDGKSQSEVVAILRNTPQQGEVDLVVSRQEKVEEIEANTLELRGKDRTGRATPSVANSPESTAPQTEESEEFTSLSPDVSVNSAGEVFPWKHREILTLDIPVHDTERAGLGVSVKGKTTGGGAKGIVDLGIFVKSVIHGGAASKDGRLKTNDQLVNINGISLLGKANCDAMDTLRRAMHEEGPTPGVITLTVARRLVVGSHQEAMARLKATGRDSVTSMLTSSSGEESYREYRVSANNTSTSMDISNNDTVIYVEKPANKPTFDNFVPPAPRNPVVDRLMGRKERLPDPGLRNDSYYRATGHDTFNATMLQRLDSPDRMKQLKSPTVHQVGGETIMIEQYGGDSGRKHARPHSPDGCEKLDQTSKSDSDATPTDGAYASQTSLEEGVAGFARDQPGRQSMSEKRHATLDAKSTDTYQRSKKARQEREQAKLEKGEVGPMLGMKKSSSLESLQTMMSEMKMDPVRAAPSRSKGSRVVRGRGCNESFRAAVDRSYEASQDNEDQEGVEDGRLSVADQEVMETFDRADYRQSGSSLDSNNDFKKKKNGKLFKGFGMFKFGKQRAKSSDSGRLSQLADRKTPTAELNYARHTPTGEVREVVDRIEREGGWRDEEARAKLVAEQARIQQHYRRLVQQRQDSEQVQGELVEEVYQGVEHRHGGGEALPASLAAARPGSRSGITGTPSDPRFANYEEIQRHLSRRQAQYHSQRREHPARSDRPVSNFYEYESVQSNISHGRQLSQGSSGSGGGGQPSQTHHQSGLPVYHGDGRGHRLDMSPTRHEMPPPPPRLQPPPPHYRNDVPPPYVRQGRAEGGHGAPPAGSLSVAPLPGKYAHYSGRGQGDYEEHRVLQMQGNMGDYDDPYGRIMFRGGGPAGRRPSHPGTLGGGGGQGPHKAHHMQHSVSQSRIQSHQVPKNQQLYIPSSLPPGSKV